MNARRQALRHVARGEPVPADLLSEADLLETLVERIDRDCRRRAVARVLVHLPAALLIPLILGVCASDLFLGILLLVCTAAPAVIVVELARPYYQQHSRTTQEALRWLRADVLPHATAHLLPSLLRLRAVLTRPLAPPTPQVARDEIDDCLVRLLETVQSPESLAPALRHTLRHLARHSQDDRPERTVAALLALAEADDRSLRRLAQRWSRSHPDEKVSAAAAEYLAVVERKR